MRRTLKNTWVLTDDEMEMFAGFLVKLGDAVGNDKKGYEALALEIDDYVGNDWIGFMNPQRLLEVTS